MSQIFQAPLLEDWVAIVDTPASQPYQDGQQDYYESIPCTAFRHYSTCEEWYQYVTGYMAAKLVDEWAQAEAEADDLVEGMLDNEYHARGQW